MTQQEKQEQQPLSKKENQEIFVSQNPRKENATRTIERSAVLDATENSNKKKTEKLPLGFATLVLKGLTILTREVSASWNKMRREWQLKKYKEQP